MAPVNHHFALVWEIDRDASANVALNLACAPFWVRGVLDTHTWRENGVQIFHRGLSCAAP